MKSDFDDKRHTSVCAHAIAGVSIFGFVGGFATINWKEKCPNETIWVEIPPYEMDVQSCE